MTNFISFEFCFKFYVCIYFNWIVLYLNERIFLFKEINNDMEYDCTTTSSINLTHHQKFDQIGLGDRNSQKTKIGDQKVDF
jgi:hypothetical protein